MACTSRLTTTWTADGDNETQGSSLLIEGASVFPFWAVWRRGSGPLSENPSLLLTLDVRVDAGIMAGVIGAVGC